MSVEVTSRIDFTSCKHGEIEFGDSFYIDDADVEKYVNAGLVCKTSKSTKRVVVLGDSLTGQTSYETSNAFALRDKGALGWAIAYSGINVDYKQEYMLGVGGEQSHQILARVQDALALKPDIVIVTAGGNDMLNGVDPDVTISNIKEIITYFIRNQIDVVMCTVPTATTTTSPADWHRLNYNIIDYCRDNSVECCRLDNAYIDPSIAWPSHEVGAVSDGIHYSGRGAELVGIKLAQNMRNLIPSTDDLPSLTGDSDNLSDDPMGVSSGYVLVKDAGATISASVTSQDDTARGSWYELTITDGSTGNNYAGIAMSGLDISNKKIQAVIEVEVENIIDLEYIYLELRNENPATDKTYSRMLYPVDSGFTLRDGNKSLIMRALPVDLPDNTDDIRLTVNFKCTSGTIKLGRNRIWLS